jgi:hypothetical protein
MRLRRQALRLCAISLLAEEIGSSLVSRVSRVQSIRAGPQLEKDASKFPIHPPSVATIV